MDVKCALVHFWTTLIDNLHRARLAMSTMRQRHHVIENQNMASSRVVLSH